MSYSEIKTKNGYQADEVISALQKEIRRGKTEEAAFWAYELMRSDLEKKFWQRLNVISVEDIGLANSQAPVLIKTLEQTYFEMPEGRGDRYMRGIFAAVYLASSKKDRFIDELYNCLRDGLIEKKEIPDYALDKHTEAGRKKGRDMKHFWQEGAKLENESEGRDNKYLARILEKL